MKALVCVVRGLHLGYLGCYGSPDVATPTLDRLAAEGVVFDNHIADQPTPQGALLSWRTACYRFAEESHVPSLGFDLFARLREGGIALLSIESEGAGNAETRTAALIRQVRLAKKRLASERHWLLWIDLNWLSPPWQVARHVLERFTAPAQDEANQEDEEDLPAPILDPCLGPFDPAEEEDLLRAQDGYACAVMTLDETLGAFLEELELTDGLTMVTSDRGFPLGEHGVIGNDPASVHEECVHVPLVARLPGQQRAGRRVPALTQAIDLTPTLLEYFGLSIPDVHGRSLWPLCLGQAAAVREGAVSAGETAWALRTPDWSLILPLSPDEPQRQLYVKPDDRWEVNNLVQHHPELADNLERLLRDWARAASRPGPFSPPPLKAYLSKYQTERSEEP